MATQTVPPPPLSAQMVQVPVTGGLPGVQPVVSVGELVRFVVRENNAGLGKLYLRGVLVPASLPSDLAAGDKVLAKVMEANDRLVFKILDSQRGTGNALALAGSTSGITEEISALVKELGATGLRGPLPLLISNGKNTSPEKILGDLSQRLRDLLGALGSEKELGTSAGAYQQMLASTDGTLTAELRAAAANIRSLLGQPLSPGQQYLSALQGELARFLGEEKDSNPLVLKRFLENLLGSLSDQLKNNRQLTDKERSVMQQVHDELRRAGDTPAELRKALDQANNSLSTSTLVDARKNLGLDSKTTAMFREVAERLENLAQTQERLNQLNPLMQALGEPALILFPFLAHGLLSHSEVTVQSRNEGRKHQHGKRKNGEGEETSETNSAPYQRIQVSVPLPTMGVVDVDIAHRQDEILVRFTVEDPEVGEFLLGQLEHLATVLRAQNFKRAELVAHVGQAAEHTPTWALSLRAGTSVFA